jgi:hypothetical protein
MSGTIEFLYRVFDDKGDVTQDVMGRIYNVPAYTCNMRHKTLCMANTFSSY